MKEIVFDIAETLFGPGETSYADASPRMDVVELLRQYRNDGFKIVLHVGHNMLQHGCNASKYAANVLPIVQAWLAQHGVPYDVIDVTHSTLCNDELCLDDEIIDSSCFLNQGHEELNMPWGSENQLAKVI